MIFGPVAVGEADGAILAHSFALPGARIGKGTVLGPSEIRALREAGVQTVVVGRLEPGDVDEDEAARRVAEAWARAGTRVDPPRAGRCNVRAHSRGLVSFDSATVGEANAALPGVTLATRHPWSPVTEGELVATAKVVPLAVPGSGVLRLEELLGRGKGLRVLSYRAATAGLVLTRLPGSRRRLEERARTVTAGRLSQVGGRLAAVRVVGHRPAEVAEALRELREGGCDLLLVLGASAAVDPRDVVPAGVRRAGGRIHRFGIPVDPGNLLLTGALGPVPVVVMPGCARSPRRSGLDVVLERILVGGDPGDDDVAGSGVGGLLPEIPTRPRPREEPGRRRGSGSDSVGAMVLAAGRSTRMAGGNKLLRTVGGVPIVVRAVDTLLATRAHPVVVVTGHQAPSVETALRSRPVRYVRNPDHAEGMGTSLARGAGVLSDEGCGWLLVMLGDMPRVRPQTVEAVLDSRSRFPEALVHVPVHGGRRGHPVLWSAELVPELSGLGGDRGARSLMDDHADRVREVPVDDPGILLDVDTEAAWAEMEASAPPGKAGSMDEPDAHPAPDPPSA